MFRTKNHSSTCTATLSETPSNNPRQHSKTFHWNRHDNQFSAASRLSDRDCLRRVHSQMGFVSCRKTQVDRTPCSRHRRKFRRSGQFEIPSPETLTGAKKREVSKASDSSRGVVLRVACRHTADLYFLLLFALSTFPPQSSLFLTPLQNSLNDARQLSFRGDMQLTN